LNAKRGGDLLYDSRLFDIEAHEKGGIEKKGGKEMRKYRYLIGFTVLILLIGLIPVKTSLGKPYYQGKTLAILVPHGAGGGTDVFARLIARHLPKYIPGKPTVIVRNMLGGMTLVCANYIYLTAKKDGLSCMGGSGVTAMHNLIKTKGTKFTYDDMPVALVVPSGDTFYTRPKLCPKPEDIVKVGRNLVYGNPPVPFATTVDFMLTKEVLGFQTKKDVLAFDSAADTRRAFIAGELDIMLESSIGYAKGAYPLVKKGEVLPLWQSGVYDPKGRLVRQGGVIADVPTVEEMYERIYGKSPSGPAWEALSAYILCNRTINKSLLFPPGTEKYAAIVRKAAVKMAKDPAFQKEAKKIFLGAPVYTGEDATNIIKTSNAKAKAVRTWLQEWLNKGWGVEFEK
jgi:tripartite-type tricarboxylate transporter receptor subunit TctC